MTKQDIVLLRFVHDRLEHVNGDRHGVDFLIALRELTDREEKLIRTQNVKDNDFTGTDVNTDIEKSATNETFKCVCGWKGIKYAYGGNCPQCFRELDNL